MICSNTHRFYAPGSGVLQPGITQVWCLKGHVPHVGLILVLQWRLIPGSRCDCHRGSEKVNQDTTPVRQLLLMEREGSGTKAECIFSLLDEEVLELMENEDQSLYVTPSPQGLFIRQGSPQDLYFRGVHCSKCTWLSFPQACRDPAHSLFLPTQIELLVLGTVFSLSQISPSRVVM